MAQGAVGEGKTRVMGGRYRRSNSWRVTYCQLLSKARVLIFPERHKPTTEFRVSDPLSSPGAKEIYDPTKIPTVVAIPAGI